MYTRAILFNNIAFYLCSFVAEGAWPLLVLLRLWSGNALMRIPMRWGGIGRCQSETYMGIASYDEGDIPKIAIVRGRAGEGMGAK